MFKYPEKLPVAGSVGADSVGVGSVDGRFSVLI